MGKVALPRRVAYENACRLSDPGALADFSNVPTMAAVLMRRNMATLHELQTIYSLEDAYRMHEVLTVSDYNEWMIGELHRQQQERNRHG